MKLIRSRLAPIAAYAFPTRYVEETNTVQASFDGGTTWEDFPEGDPRKNNHTPPPDTSDPRCDAAARIRAATEAEATAVIEQVDFSATLMPIVTGFLRLFTPLFTVIPYLGLAYTLIQAILSIGSVALHAAFDTFDWDAFECLLWKYIDADGRISEDGFVYLLDDIANTYSDATETLLYNFYYLAGRAGLNDQAGIRTETGDCSACPNTFDRDERFNDPLLPGTYTSGYHLGAYPNWVLNCGLVSDVGCSLGSRNVNWVLDPYSQRTARVLVDFGKDVHLDYYTMGWWASGGHNYGLQCTKEDGTVTAFVAYNTPLSGGAGCLQNVPHQALGVDARYFTWLITYNTSNQVRITRCRLEGYYL